MRRNLDQLRFVLFLFSFLLSDVIIWSFLQLTTIFFVGYCFYYSVFLEALWFLSISLIGSSKFKRMRERALLSSCSWNFGFAVMSSYSFRTIKY